jgi:hypothetical protein
MNMASPGATSRSKLVWPVPSSATDSLATIISVPSAAAAHA